jgi:hypothetical protein
VLTGKVVGLAINYLGHWFPFLGKYLLPGPLLLPVLFSLADIPFRKGWISLLGR